MYSLERKDDAMSVCYDIMQDKMSVSKEEFISLPNIDSIAITYGGETIGCAFVQDDLFFHLAVREDHQGKWAYNMWPDLVHYLLTTYTQVYAPVAKYNTKTQSLMTKAGFSFIEEDSTHTWWCLSYANIK